MRNRILVSIVACSLSAMFALPLLAQQIDKNDAVSISPVNSLPSFTPVPRATSTLTRTDEAVSLEIHTSGLGAEYAYSVWWFLFKDGCSPCTPGVNPRVVKNATGGVSDKWGQATFSAHLTRDEIGVLVGGDPNVTIHAIVRSHGPAKTLRAQGLLEEAFTTTGGGCGATANNVCSNVQGTVHEKTVP